jgi:hypothetical protein
LQKKNVRRMMSAGSEYMEQVYPPSILSFCNDGWCTGLIHRQIRNYSATSHFKHTFIHCQSYKLQYILLIEYWHSTYSQHEVLSTKSSTLQFTTSTCKFQVSAWIILTVSGSIFEHHTIAFHGGCSANISYLQFTL